MAVSISAVIARALLAATPALSVGWSVALGAPGGSQLTFTEPYVALRLGGKSLARSEYQGMFSILYSDASDLWEAQTWRELKPDAIAFQREGDAETLRVTSFGGQPVELVSIAKAEGDVVVWRLSVHNRAPGTVVGVCGPAMSGIVPIDGGALYIPNRPGHILPKPWEALPNAPAHLVYPVPASMQYMVYAGAAGGVAYHIRDQEMLYKELVFGGKRRELSVIEYPFVAPGESWRSPAIVWQPLDRDWHEAADLYRRWFRSWAHKPVVSPQVLAYPIMGGTVIKARPVNDPHLHDVRKSQEVGTYAAALVQAKQLKAAGFQGTHLVGWFGQGHDTTYPDYPPSPAMGGVAGLKALVDGMHAMGMMVTFYLNARLANLHSPTYLAHLDWRAKLPNGRVWEETYGNQHFTCLCPACKGFQDHLIAEVVKVARDYHGDGAQLDQVGAASAVLCFDRTHGHRTPASAWAEGYMSMLPRIREATRRVQPHFWTWIEGCWDGAGQYVDASQGGFWPDVPGAQPFPQMYRYTLPEHIMFGDPSMGGIPYWCPTDIHRAAKINAAVGDIFRKGDFMDDIDMSTEPATECHWFREGSRLVATVSNHGNEPQTYRVRLKTDARVANGRALAAGQDVAVTDDAGTIAFDVAVPPRQVEAVLLTR